MYWLMVASLCVMVGNAETECCFSCQNHRDVLVDGGLSVCDGGECRDSAASVARTTDMYRLMVGCLCMMVGNAETEHCFGCQNHRDVSVDGGLSVCDGGYCRDGALLRLPEPQRCIG